MNTSTLPLSLLPSPFAASRCKAALTRREWRACVWRLPKSRDSACVSVRLSSTRGLGTFHLHDAHYKEREREKETGDGETEDGVVMEIFAHQGSVGWMVWDRDRKKEVALVKPYDTTVRHFWFSLAWKRRTILLKEGFVLICMHIFSLSLPELYSCNRLALGVGFGGLLLLYLASDLILHPSD